MDGGRGQVPKSMLSKLTSKAYNSPLLDGLRSTRRRPFRCSSFLAGLVISSRDRWWMSFCTCSDEQVNECFKVKVDGTSGSGIGRSSKEGGEFLRMLLRFDGLMMISRDKRKKGNES